MNLFADDSWAWKKVNGLAVLRERFKAEETPFDEQSLRTALATVQAQRQEYVTEEAWKRQLRKFSDGLACLVGTGNPGVHGGTEP